MAFMMVETDISASITEIPNGEVWYYWQNMSTPSKLTLLFLLVAN